MRIVIAGEQGALRTQSREVIRQLPLEKSDRIRAVHADHSQIVQPDKERFSEHWSGNSGKMGFRMRIPSDHLEARPRPDAPARSVLSMPAAQPAPAPPPVQEIGGPAGPEPT